MITVFGGVAVFFVGGCGGGSGGSNSVGTSPVVRASAAASANKESGAKGPPETSESGAAQREQAGQAEVETFERSPRGSTILVATTSSGLRVTAHVRVRDGRLCSGVEARVGQGSTFASHCRPAASQGRFQLVIDSQRKGAVLVIEGYSRCDVSVGSTREDGEEACISRPAKFRLVPISADGTVHVDDAGPLHSLRLSRFRCSGPQGGACIFPVLPTGAPG